MVHSWNREDVKLGMVFTKDGLDSPEPLLYRVVALVDKPMVVLQPVDARDGEEQSYHVIESPNFGEYRRVELRAPDDSVQFGAPAWEEAEL